MLQRLEFFLALIALLCCLVVFLRSKGLDRFLDRLLRPKPETATELNREREMLEVKKEELNKSVKKRKLKLELEHKLIEKIDSEQNNN